MLYNLSYLNTKHTFEALCYKEVILVPQHIENHYSIQIYSVLKWYYK